MATHEKVVAPASSERQLSINQLTAIDGIARRTAEAMYEIGFQDYAGLAQYLGQHSAKEVSSALKEYGVNRPPAFIDQATWARQAIELGELENITPTPPEGKVVPTKKPEEAPTSRESRDHGAVFTVSFEVATEGDREPVLRTMVSDAANGDQEGVFEGNGTAPWVNWMLERANLPVAVEHVVVPVEAVSSVVSTDPGDNQIEIGDVQLSVIGSTANDRKKRLKAVVGFRLSGSSAETLASKGISFRIEGYALDVESGVSELVATDQGQLASQVFEYVGQQEFRIPDVGQYEFHTIVLLLPPGESVAYQRGPTIRVVP